MVIIMMAMKINLQFYMSIKNRIKFKKLTEIGVQILPLAFPWTLAMMGNLATTLGVLRERVPFATESPRTK